MPAVIPRTPLAHRFRSYLPVVVDVEAGGFNAQTDALLQIAAVVLTLDENNAITTEPPVSCHVQPFPGARLDPASLKFTGIDPDHPLRIAQTEAEALQKIFEAVRRGLKQHGCTRAILVGHNPNFDLAFLNAAVARTDLKRNPFHPFCTFDTATLAGLAYGQTVLRRAVEASGQPWDEAQAHSARYDAEQTARLFCGIVNQWDRCLGPPAGTAG